MRRAGIVALAAWCAAAATLGGTQAPAAGGGPGTPSQPRIWQGVYTTAQAERGKTVFEGACIRCHGGDLAGTTAPALKGERFMASWGGDALSRLFEKIRDTMPPNFSTTLDETAKIEILAYILQVNGFPAGPRELAAGSELSAIQVLRQGEQPRVQNFSLVQAVGCLARGTPDTWVLQRTSTPVATTADTPSADALGAAAAVPLGGGTFVLLNAAPFKPAEQAGRKVEARGLIYQQAGDSLLTVTSLRTVGECS